ncbi:hypothetical protein Tco_0112583, partial [Tanacetum coccineum]
PLLKLAWSKLDMYFEEADVSKDMLGSELTHKRQSGQRAKRKYQPSDCLADPRRQPPFSCRQLGYEGATSGGAKLNPIITKIEAHLLSPTGPRKFASTYVSVVLVRIWVNVLRGSNAKSVNFERL